MAGPREGVRMAGAPLLCPCLWSHRHKGQGLVPKHPWVPGTVLASGGCQVRNSLCQGRTPPAQGRSGVGDINKLLWLFSLSGEAEGWPCQVPSRRHCLHGTGSCQSPVLGLARTITPPLPRKAGDGQHCSCCGCGSVGPLVPEPSQVTPAPEPGESRL